MDAIAPTQNTAMSLVCLTTPRGEVPVDAGGVVLCACVPGVVRDLVVVEDRDPGVAGMRCLQVRIGFVQGVPEAVVAQVDRLGRRYAVTHPRAAGRPVGWRGGHGHITGPCHHGQGAHTHRGSSSQNGATEQGAGGRESQVGALPARVSGTRDA